MHSHKMHPECCKFGIGPVQNMSRAGQEDNVIELSPQISTFYDRIKLHTQAEYATRININF